MRDTELYELELCPGCGEPAHATESDDDGYHAGCRPDAREAALERSEQPCWLCGAKQEHAGIEPDESWDWSEYVADAPKGDRHGPNCVRCTEENE